MRGSIREVAVTELHIGIGFKRRDQQINGQSNPSLISRVTCVHRDKNCSQSGLVVVQRLWLRKIREPRFAYEELSPPLSNLLFKLGQYTATASFAAAAAADGDHFVISAHFLY